MRFLVPGAAKLNLSLRVTSVRSDGYHNIVSLFLRLPSVETIFVSEGEGEDRVCAQGMEIEGENIVVRALRRTREAGRNVPFLNVEIHKTLYPGSGLGAGSGNAAAVLRWLAGDDDAPFWRDVALKTGADVPFLFSGNSLALVSGIGEVIEPLVSPMFHAWIVFPEWSVGTENAYGVLDSRYGGVYPKDEAAARAEAGVLYRRLAAKERVGFLPNDFAAGLIEKFPEYDGFFKLFDSAGSISWGITGSGGAAFALFRDAPRPLSIAWPERIRQVVSLVAGNEEKRL